MISAISNVSVLTAGNALNRTVREQNNVFMRLATGRRINSGKDDPAGLISSEQLAAEIKALEAETQNLRRSDSNARITDGHVGELSSLYNELNGLVVAASNTAGLTDGEQQAYQMQIDSVVGSIQRITGDAMGSLDGIVMPDGGNATVEGQLSGASTSIASLVSGGANSLASGNFDAAQTAVLAAISDVATARGTIGAYQRYTIQPGINNANIAIENLSDARSRIADTNFAVETSNLSRLEILTKSGMKVLKIAQQQTAQILDLFA